MHLRKLGDFSADRILGLAQFFINTSGLFAVWGYDDPAAVRAG